MGSCRYPIELTKVVKKFKNFTALDGSLIYHGKRIDVKSFLKRYQDLNSI